MTPQYFVDDRGNAVDFYDQATSDRVARLDREAEVDGVPDCCTWDGSDTVTTWAIKNGYAAAIESATRIC